MDQALGKDALWAITSHVTRQCQVAQRIEVHVELATVLFEATRAASGRIEAPQPD